VAQVVEHLPTKREALSSSPSTEGGRKEFLRQSKSPEQNDITLRYDYGEKFCVQIKKNVTTRKKSRAYCASEGL
jgi:hypothetical protein